MPLTKSPRKKTQVKKLPLIKKPRAQQLCGKCDVQPKVLRNQCPHTKAGRAYLASQVNEPPSFILPIAGAGDPEESLQHVPVLLAEPTSSTFSSETITSSTTPQLALQGSPQPPKTPQRSIISSSRVFSPIGVTPTTRRLISENDDLSSTPASQASATFDQVSEPVNIVSPMLTARVKQGTVLKPTKNNSFLGVVCGAYRGQNEFQFPRELILRPVQKIQSKATARFRSEVLKIITKAEILAHETGCWLFFTAQHVEADGAFWHYASPRLVRDAHQELNSVIAIFHKVFQILLAAGAKQKIDHQSEIFDLKQKHGEKISDLEQELLEKNREIESMRILMATRDSVARDACTT